MRIDSHQHFWNYDPIKHSWITEEMSVLKRDYTPSDLFECLEQSDLDGCVAVQADQTEDETKFLLSLAKENEFIKGVVGWIDLRSEKIENQLKQFSNSKHLVGFRHVVQDEPEPDFMLGDAFQKGLGLLKKYNFTYDILIFPTQLEAALQTVQKHPDQQFVIDHVAKPYIRDGKLENWATYMRKIATNPNVMCKISGMVTEADWKHWKYEDFIPYLDVVVEAFGTKRLMYGSDWPVCLLGGSYLEVKEIIDQYFERFDEQEKQQIYGLNAINFYGLK